MDEIGFWFAGSFATVLGYGRPATVMAYAVDFEAFDQQLQASGFLPMGGRIVEATLVSAPSNATMVMKRQHQRGQGD